MNTTIQNLAEICRRYPFEEKTLFVPSHPVGRQIVEHLAKAGTSWINLRWTTPSAWAQRLVALDLSARGLRYIGEQEQLIIIEGLFRENTSPGRYFEKAEETPGIISSLTRAIHELRMAGLTHDTVEPSAFIVPEKGEDLIRLLQSYESYLSEKKRVDPPGLLTMAIEKLKGGKEVSKDSLYLLLLDFPLSGLEKELIREVGGKNLITVDHTAPEGLHFPERFFTLSTKQKAPPFDPMRNCDLLPWLFEPQNAPKPFGDDSVSLFRAMGESNEIRETFRRILTNEIPFDDVELITATTDPYFQIIYEMTMALDIPATFMGGLPILYTLPARALILFFQWQVEDFQDTFLRQLFAGGHIDLKRFDFEGQRPGGRQAIALIREAAIGWGRERYASRFQTLQHDLEKSAAQCCEEGDNEKAEIIKRKANSTVWLKHLCRALLEITPRADSDGNISTVDLYEGALQFLKRYCRIHNELDGKAKSRLIDFLSSLTDIESVLLTVPEAAERLMKTISGFSIGHKQPQPGQVHVAHYRSGGYSGRSHIFVLGLSQDIFPGALLQDPVILDDERHRLKSALTDSGELLHENVYMMARLLSSQEGKITLSYPCRDLREDRERFPASILLGVYRIVTGDHTGDYTALEKYLGHPAGFTPAEESMPLNDWEWWLREKKHHYGRESVHSVYPHLRQGHRAEMERQMNTLGTYDGWIPSLCETWNPFSEDVVFSCSGLEYLARCPFKYFLSYHLDISPLEELEKEPGMWLDGAQRGSLLHDVFYRFMRTIRKNDERPQMKKHLELLKSIAMEEVEKWKDDVPPPGDLVFQREVQEILDSLHIFLLDEEERCRKVEPMYFELSFGSDPKDEPVSITLKGIGQFRLRGRIDRIDRCDEHLYEVWDYKTGSAARIKEHKYADGGRQLQHALYALAAETILRKRTDPEARVVLGGYFFPTKKAEGRRIGKPMNRERLHHVLEPLFVLLQKGMFPSSYDRGGCYRCDYKTICGGPEVAVSRCNEKLEVDPKLKPFRILKDDATS